MSLKLTQDEYTSLAFVLARQSLAIAPEDVALAVHCKQAMQLIEREALQ